MNKANYEAWQDPEGGEWIRLTGTELKGMTFRPADLSISEDGNLGFQLDVFEGPDTPELTQELYSRLGQIAGKIITDIVAQETAELQTIAETEEAKEQEPQKPELSDHISSIEMLQGGTQVSPAMMPQDLSMDLAQIEGIIGSVAPQEKD